MLSESVPTRKVPHNTIHAHRHKAIGKQHVGGSVEYKKQLQHNKRQLLAKWVEVKIERNAKITLKNCCTLHVKVSGHINAMKPTAMTN